MCGGVGGAEEQLKSGSDQLMLSSGLLVSSPGLS